MSTVVNAALHMHVTNIYALLEPMLFIQGIVKMTQAITVRTLALYLTFVATFNMRELCVENSVDFVI